MSDLNIAFVSDDLANDLIENLGCDDDAERCTSAEAIVDRNNEHEQGFMMTAYSVSSPSIAGESSTKECVWETCYSVPANPINSHASKRKLHLSESQKMEVKSGDSMVRRNHMKLKTNAKCKSRRRKKTENFTSGKINVGHKNDLYLPFEMATLQAHDAGVPLGVSTVTCATTECVDNVADHMTELSARFEQNTFTQQVRIGACSDVDVSGNLSQIGSLSASVCQTVMAGLPDKNQKKEILKKDKQSKTRSTKAGMSLILEQQNEKRSEQGGSSAVEEHEECAETATVQLQGIVKATIIASLKYLTSYAYIFLRRMLLSSCVYALMLLLVVRCSFCLCSIPDS